MRNNVIRLLPVLAICIISLLMHLNIFQKDLIGFHVWRQTETQTVINNYINSTTPFSKPLRNDISENNGVHIREFPLMQWGFAQIAKNFENPYVVSRVLTFIIGCFSILGIYLLCVSVFKDQLLSVIGCWAICFSPVFYYYCVNPLPDNLALCLSIFSSYFSIKWNQSENKGDFIYAVLLLCFATLIKLPFALTGGALFYFVCAYLYNKKSFSKKLVIITMSLLAFLPCLFWYLYSIPHWNGVGAKNGIFDESFSISNSLDIIQHNLISTLPELFVNYAALPVFLIGIYVFIRKKNKGIIAQAMLFQLILLILFFLFEHNMIAKVHDYYLLPFLPIVILTIVAGLNSVLSYKNQSLKAIFLVMIALMPLTAYLRINTRWNEESPGFNSGFYKNKEEIRTILPENAICIVGEDESQYIQLYYLDRKGFTYSQQNFSQTNLEKWIKMGATHFVTDKPYDTITFVKNILGEKIFEKDEVRIYKIK